jgi:hypothetical protein
MIKMMFGSKIKLRFYEILHHEKRGKIPLLVHADCFVTDESLVVKVCLKEMNL